LVLSIDGKEKPALFMDYTRGDVAGDYVPPGFGLTYPEGYVRERDVTLLYDFGRSEYLFHAPGEYTLRVLLDIWEGDRLETYKVLRLASNSLALTVQDVPQKSQPAVQLWRGREQAIVMLSDSLQEAQRFPAGLSKLQELIQRCPATTYAKLAKEHLSKLETEGSLFPDDKRLDRKVSISFPEMTPLDEVFAYVAKETKVPLSLDDSLKKRRLKSFPLDTLREFMKWMSAYKAQWIPDGKGYRLVPKEDKPVGEQK
jgi:hypothetical protein